MQSAVRLPRRPAKVPGGCRNVRREIAHGVVSADGVGDGDRIEEVDRGRAAAHASYELCLGRAASDPGDLVAGRDEGGDGLAPEDPRGSGDEDPHVCVIVGE